MVFITTFTYHLVIACLNDWKIVMSLIFCSMGFNTTISGSPTLPAAGPGCPEQASACAYCITLIGLSAVILVGFVNTWGLAVKAAGYILPLFKLATNTPLKYTFVLSSDAITR